MDRELLVHGEDVCVGDQKVARRRRGHYAQCTPSLAISQ
jgi:hypothetical protein